MTWLSIDWQGFGGTEPWTGYLADQVRVAASDVARAFAVPMTEAVRLVWSVVDPEVRLSQPYPDVTVTEESRSPRHRRAKFTAKPPEAK